MVDERLCVVLVAVTEITDDFDGWNVQIRDRVQSVLEENSEDIRRVDSLNPRLVAL